VPVYIKARIVTGFRKLLSQQRARNAETATAEAEEVIRSRPGTPKLLKTVIKVRHSAHQFAAAYGLMDVYATKFVSPVHRYSKRDTHCTF